MTIRRTAAWMQQLDDRILEHLESESWSSPSVMASRPEFRFASEARLRERCRMLLYAGFIAPISEEMVEITTWGQLYLDGELDAEHQPRPNGRILPGKVEFTQQLHTKSQI